MPDLPRDYREGMGMGRRGEEGLTDTRQRKKPPVRSSPPRSRSSTSSSHAQVPRPPSCAPRRPTSRPYVSCTRLTAAILCPTSRRPRFQLSPSHPQAPPAVPPRAGPVQRAAPPLCAQPRLAVNAVERHGGERMERRRGRRRET